MYPSPHYEGAEFPLATIRSFLENKRQFDESVLQVRKLKHRLLELDAVVKEKETISQNFVALGTEAKTESRLEVILTLMLQRTHLENPSGKLFIPFNLLMPDMLSPVFFTGGRDAGICGAFYVCVRYIYSYTSWKICVVHKYLNEISAT